MTHQQLPIYYHHIGTPPPQPLRVLLRNVTGALEKSSSLTASPKSLLSHKESREAISHSMQLTRLRPNGDGLKSQPCMKNNIANI